MLTPFITNFADASVMVPAALAVAGVLALAGERRAALGWGAAVSGVWTIILLLKFAGYAAASVRPDSVLARIDLVTPSGHVASAAVVYGGLAGLLLRGPGTTAWRTGVAGAAAAVAIAVTRVRLDDHSVAEVLLGGAIGLGGAGLLARWVAAPVPPRVALPIAAVVGLILVAGHGIHVSAEGTIRRVVAVAIGG